MELNTIKSPELTAANFGEGVANVFDQIDENFRRVSAYDFIKGEDGRSLDIVTHYFQDDIQSDQIVENSVSKAILDSLKDIPGVTESGMADMNGISLYNNFLNKEAGYILLIYNDGKGNQDRGTDWESGLCGCMPYTFIDPRYVSLPSSTEEMSAWDDIIDCSCVITWSSGSFKPIQAFPVFYYDSDQNQFCWKIANNRTGLIARGPEGPAGKSGSFIICLVRRKDEATGAEGTVNSGDANLNGVYPIAYYLTESTANAQETMGSVWEEVKALNVDWIGRNAIVFETTAEGSDIDVDAFETGRIYWITSISQRAIDGVDKNVVSLSNLNGITTDMGTESFINSMNNITNLFIPMKMTIEDSPTKPVHVAISDQLGLYDLRNNLILGSASRFDQVDELLQKVKVYYTDSSGKNWTLTSKPTSEPSDESKPFTWTNGSDTVKTNTLLPATGINMHFATVDGYEIPKDKFLSILYNIAILGELNVSSISGDVIMSNTDIKNIIEKVIS